MMKTLVITHGEKILLEKVLVTEKEMCNIRFERLKSALVYIKNNLILILLTVTSLIDINNIITGSNNITLRKVNVNYVDVMKCILIKI